MAGPERGSARCVYVSNASMTQPGGLVGIVAVVVDAAVVQQHVVLQVGPLA
jgi:hypothetical protein